MKFRVLLFLAALCCIRSLSSCQNDGQAPPPNTNPESVAAPATPAPSDAAPATTGVPTTPPPANVAPASTEPAQNAAGVWHYTCPKGCKGGGAAATACTNCGATLAHNQSYHGAPGTAKSPSIEVTPSSGQTPVAAPPTKKPEPAQNAAGVWHYTCPGGCAGGSGAAGPCAKCGKALAHNAVYHQ